MEYIEQIPRMPPQANSYAISEYRHARPPSYRVTLGKQASVPWNDALAAAVAYGGKYVITTPNMTYVPAPPSSPIDVRVKTDGKFGREDPLHWPQLYSNDPKINFMCCIPRSSSSARRAEIWEPLTTRDLIKYEFGSILVSPTNPPEEQEPIIDERTIVTLRPERLEPINDLIETLLSEQIEYEGDHGPSQQLQWLISGAQLARDRLSHPGTQRDLLQQLVCVERHYCLTLAWLLWRRYFEDMSMHTRAGGCDLMGCFTTDGEAVGRLARAGIPVWYVRPAETLVGSCGQVVNIVDVTQPVDIPVTNRYGSVSLYRGLPGAKQLEVIYHKGHVYADIESVPLPDDYALDDKGNPIVFDHDDDDDGRAPVSGSDDIPHRTHQPGTSSGAQRHTRENKHYSKPCK